MRNSSNLIFGSSTNLALAATPSMGSYLVAYDSSTGYLSQKDGLGIISRIGIAPTASGILEIFPSDIHVSLAPGKSFGKYVNGDVIPAYNKSAVEVIIDSLSEPIPPTISLSSPTNIDFNQTSIENVLNFSYVINSYAATIESVLLEWKRSDSVTWNTLSTDTLLTTYTHTLTDSGFNTLTFNYRYTATDSQGATNVISFDITPITYQAPTISFAVSGVTLTSPETNSKREKGNISSNLSGLITKNSSLVNLSYYELQYQSNGSGSWLSVGGTVSISGATAAIPTTNNNDSLNLSNSTSIIYRVQVTDEYQTTTSLTSTVNLLNIIFYGATNSVPSSSSDVRNLSNRIFTDGSNPFILNTGDVYNNFTIALPTTISQVLDLDALSVNITSSYILNTLTVQDFYGTNVSYNVYTMTNAIAYSDSHRHQITR
jgi:hypothetical protein